MSTISRSRYYVGIDPGVITGYAIWDSKEKKYIDIGSNQILKVMNFMVSKILNKQDYLFIIEDARKRKFFRGENMTAKAQGAGSVKRDSQIWEEYCTMYGFKYVLRHPRNTKINSVNFKKITGVSIQTNSHSRDAAMSVFKM